MRTFIGTNVLVYAYDRADSEKHDRAITTLAGLDPSDLTISTQVLDELPYARTAGVCCPRT